MEVQYLVNPVQLQKGKSYFCQQYFIVLPLRVQVLDQLYCHSFSQRSLCQGREAFKLFFWCVCLFERLLSARQGVRLWRRLAVKLHNASYVRVARRSQVKPSPRTYHQGRQVEGIFFKLSITSMSQLKLLPFYEVVCVFF